MNKPFSEAGLGIEQTLTKTQQHWLGHWQQCKVSGQSMAAYARDHGLPIKSFYYWGQQVRAWQADKKPDLAQAAQFHPVRLTADDLPSLAGTAMHVQLRLPNGIECDLRQLDPRLCIDVLAALSRLPT